MTDPIDPIAYAWKTIHGAELPKELGVNFGRDISKGSGGARGRYKKPVGSTFVRNPEKGIRG